MRLYPLLQRVSSNTLSQLPSRIHSRDRLNRSRGLHTGQHGRPTREVRCFFPSSMSPVRITSVVRASFSVTSTSTLQPGDTERLSFNIEADGELMGVGLILPTRNSATTISWKFVGEDLRPSSSRGTQSPASTDGASDAGGALGSAVNAMPQRLTILLPLLRLLYSL